MSKFVEPNIKSVSFLIRGTSPYRPQSMFMAIAGNKHCYLPAWDLFEEILGVKISCGLSWDHKESRRDPKPELCMVGTTSIINPRKEKKLR